MVSIAPAIVYLLQYGVRSSRDSDWPLKVTGFLRLSSSAPAKISTGNYEILNCDNDPASQTVNGLQTLWRVLQPALNDLQAGAKSQAYQTFFKDISYAPFVQDILTKIEDGAKVSPGLNAHHNFGETAPMLACADNPDHDPNKIPKEQRSIFEAILAYAYNYCPSALSAWMLETPVIVLCRNFFKHPRMPTRGICPFGPDLDKSYNGGYILLNSQVANLLTDIAHYYIHSKEPGDGVLSKKVYRVVDCFHLDAKASSFNPNNYVFYVFSKLLFAEPDS
ncbi:MAG: hypothetical protein Q9220_005496 [cf. Caloplaca sp. 1 TL-2023]